MTTPYHFDGDEFPKPIQRTTSITPVAYSTQAEAEGGTPGRELHATPNSCKVTTICRMGGPQVGRLWQRWEEMHRGSQPFTLSWLRKDFDTRSNTVPPGDRAVCYFESAPRLVGQTNVENARFHVGFDFYTRGAFTLSEEDKLRRGADWWPSLGDRPIGVAGDEGGSEMEKDATSTIGVAADLFPVMLGPPRMRPGLSTTHTFRGVILMLPITQRDRLIEFWVNNFDKIFAFQHPAFGYPIASTGGTARGVWARFVQGGGLSFRDHGVDVPPDLDDRPESRLTLYDAEIELEIFEDSVVGIRRTS